MSWVISLSLYYSQETSGQQSAINLLIFNIANDNSWTWMSYELGLKDRIHCKSIIDRSMKKESHGPPDSLSLTKPPLTLEASSVTRNMTEGWLIVTSVCRNCFIHHAGDAGLSL